MKNVVLALFLSALFLVSCTSEKAELYANGILGARGNGVVKKKPVPFKGTFETISVPLGPPLADPPRQLQRITGEGQASHLGKATFEASSTIFFAPQPPFTNSGTSTMTAANGDKLYSTFTGTIVPQPDGKRLVTVRHTITGGTGRFDRASGYYVGVTLADPTTPSGTLNIEGELSY
ncbi:hypothetical protein SAMN00120144_1953 [Hymenobacter roseosalivarius DSM 11622]|uniref:Lipoprotein n=1 Tax=Hymenobacter roseosalivarius DSM 11622 TaxID=645990 RepID=A0A1W1W3Z7_9BACT|nr:hypothetical protein [Hymenobacter roseosalivarius]SMC00339.1 hypothetical protein SAMN00120144_1953 [Hymenobacter roseosalivarius DSM 11622]